MKCVFILAGAALSLGAALIAGYVASYLQPYMMYVFDDVLISTLTAYLFVLLLAGFIVGIIADD